MSETIDQKAMLEALDKGLPVRASFWNPEGSKRNPIAICLIKGREIKAEFGPVVKALGKDTKFTTRDHIDAIFRNPETGKLEMVLNWLPLDELKKPAYAYQWMLASVE